MKPVRVMVVAILLVVLIPVFASLGGSSGTATIDPGQDWTTLDRTVDTEPSSISVDATTGNALGFGGQTTVETSVGSVPNDAWTVCAAADLDAGADPDAAYSVAAYENETIALAYDGGDWLAYHENASGYDQAVRLPAPDATSGFTPLCAQYNASGLALMRNGTIAGPQPLDQTTESRNVTWNWTGRVDEVRVYGGDLGDGELRGYATDPVEPRHGATRLARLMLDEDSGTSTTVYFASASSATVTNPNWTTGLQGPALERGTDYEIQTAPLELRAPAGGYLEGAPVAYVDWAFNLLPFDFAGLLSLFAALVVLVYIAKRLQLL